MNDNPASTADSTTEDDVFGPPIHTYTRAQAIEDGTLVDLSEWGSEPGVISPTHPGEIMRGFGFINPVAVTRALWADIENIPKGCRFQDVRGRAHDVLAMGALAMRQWIRMKRPTEGFRTYYKLTLNRVGTRKRLVILALDFSPGDDGRPVVTIGYPSDF